MFKKTIILIFFVNITILNAFCHPCICTETFSPKGVKILSSKQIGILQKEIISKLNKTEKLLKELLKQETKKEKTIKAELAVETYNTIKLKKISFDLEKMKKELYLKIKMVNNISQTVQLNNKINYEKILKKSKK
jgi:hypothetical protein